MPSITKAEYVAMTGMIERLTGEAATLREDLEEALSISKNLADDARAEREVAETLRQERDTAHAALMKMSAELDRKYSECADRDALREKLAIATDRGNVLMQERDAARAAFTQVNTTFAASTERVSQLAEERDALIVDRDQALAERNRWREEWAIVSAGYEEATRQVDALTQENEEIIASKGLRPHALLSVEQVTHICWTTITGMDWKKGLSAKQVRDLMFVGERCIEEATLVMGEALAEEDGEV